MADKNKGLNIKLNDEWYVESDTHNFILRQRGAKVIDKKKIPNTYSDNIINSYYYGSLASLLKQYVEKASRGFNSESIQAYMSEYKNFVASITDYLDLNYSHLSKHEPIG